MDNRRSKENYYLDIAEAALERSTCLRRQFGAIIVRDDEIVATGYNGAPRGRKNCMDLGYCAREAMNIPSGQRYELCRSVHAEMNAIISAARRDTLGAMEARFNSSSTPGSLTSAAAVGLFSHLYKVEQSELDLLGAEVVALSHGSPLAFLSGAALAHIISRSLSAPEVPLKNLVLEAAQSLKSQFGHQYSQSFEISNLLNLAVSLAEDSRLNPVTAMEQLHCLNAAQVLSGAVYACLRCGKSFDTAMIAAVNHSGRSAAVGAVAGAILGLRLGEKALPSFYIECLEPAETLGELAEDMLGGCTMERGSKLFDLDWDRKYIHGGK